MTREGIVLVASSLPPRPASIAAASTPAAAKATKVAAVATSNWVTSSPSSSPRLTVSAACAVRSTAAANSSALISWPSIKTRSDQRKACGETQAPARTPCACSSAAIIRVTEDLPLVPTTWIEAKRCWGSPSAVVSLCIRSRPSFQPIGSSESR